MAEPEQIGDTLNAKTEILKNNSDLKASEKGKNGGAREGAGRPKGGENKTTTIKREALQQFKDRVAKSVDRLYNSQLALATGEQYLLCKSTTGSGKDRKSVTEIVTDPEVIKQFVDGDLDGNNDEYYYISTKPANNMALDSLLNRAFGTAQKSVDLTSKGQSILGAADDTELARIAAATNEALADDTQS